MVKLWSRWLNLAILSLLIGVLGTHPAVTTPLIYIVFVIFVAVRILSWRLKHIPTLNLHIRH